MRFFFLVAGVVVTLGAVTAEAADCSTELKPSDGYKELSAKLKCLNDKIRTLEKSTASAGSSPQVSADSGLGSSQKSNWKKGQCFSSEKSQALKIVIQLKNDGKEDVLCWRDGAIMLRIREIRQNDIIVQTPSGNQTACAFSAACKYSLDGAVVSVKPEALIDADNKVAARLNIESKPE